MLSVNEIKRRAKSFVKNWKDKAANAREEADAQTFLNEFFAVFGVPRNRMAIFEKKVRLLGGAAGYIDLFWKGYILIEMKSPGKDLLKAYEQSKSYASALSDDEMPRAILISDFVRFDFYDLENDAKKTSFTLEEFSEYVPLLSFLAGYKETEYKKADAVNIRAAEKMATLHDELKAAGYTGHKNELYLVRLLFCLFADDTGIFEYNSFIRYIEEKTLQDGSDLAMHIQKIFEVLNTPIEERMKTLDESLASFPYVDGHLFEEMIPTADFTSEMREKLIECCALDWSKISPAIFGSIFQSVMDEKARHDLGAHYTSEENILKVLHPLFLDSLWKEFDDAVFLPSKTRAREQKLKSLHEKIAALKFLDPACGSGNFLVIAYRELRLLEIEILSELYGDGQQVLDVSALVKVDINQFYGIEIEDFSAEIAQTALWLLDHLMNMKVSERFGQYFIRIPLKNYHTVHKADALAVDWDKIVPRNELSYILGNPPFLGKNLMSEEQRTRFLQVFSGVKNAGELDYVTAWYKKAASYIKGTKIQAAFVSTNSVTQGEQVAILWEPLIKEGLHINFAHRTFKWSNEACGNAAVYCVIIGFAFFAKSEKHLFYYDDIKGEPRKEKVNNINAYLADADDVFVKSRARPISDVPKMTKGSQPTDGGAFIFTKDELEEFLKKEGKAKKYIRDFMGAQEFINGKKRYCLWLKGALPNELTRLPLVMERIKKVKEMREKSKKAATRRDAARSCEFQEIRQPESGDYLLVPSVSSEERKYIPIGFLPASVIASNLVLIVPGATLADFAVLTSAMHMAWMRAVAGRLKSDYRYSAEIVYNNFVWPPLTDIAREALEKSARSILDARKEYISKGATLADLYNELTMPADLRRAHEANDRLIEKLYRDKPFFNDGERVEVLFALYKTKAND